MISRYSWNSLISCHVKLGNGEKAIETYFRMQEQHVEPDKVTFLVLLKTCGTNRYINEGRVLHSQIIEATLESDVCIGSTLIDMYSKCTYMKDAEDVFYKLRNRNIVSWGALIAGYARNGHGVSALKLLDEMHDKGLVPNEAILVAALKACISLNAFNQTMLIHSWLVKSDLLSCSNVGNSLIDAYVKNGMLSEAHKVFTFLRNRDSVPWSILILGYAKYGFYIHAFELFMEMQQINLMPDTVTFLGIIKACGITGMLNHGKIVHCYIVRSQETIDIVVSNSLLLMYSDCGSLEDAENIFYSLQYKDVVSWTVFILGCYRNGDMLKAMMLFEEMLKRHIRPNLMTFSCILNVCTKAAWLEYLRLTHDLLIKTIHEFDVAIGNALIDAYGSFGNLQEAKCMFDRMPNKNVISWSVIIARCIEHDCAFLALQLAEEMQQTSIKSDKVILISFLQACGSLGACQQGFHIHDIIIRAGVSNDTVVCNALVSMYGKCRRLKEAFKIFYEIQDRDAISWDALIAAYSQNELNSKTLVLFWKMQDEKFMPLEGTFLCVLRSCGILGDLVHGQLIHDAIIKCGYECQLKLESSLIDMYAKCGSFDDASVMLDMAQEKDIVSCTAIIAGLNQQGLAFDALVFFDKMLQDGLKPNRIVYTSVLRSCGHVGAIGYGRLVHERMLVAGFEFDSTLGNALIDMYARCGSLVEARKVLDSFKQRDWISWCIIVSGWSRLGNTKMALQCIEDAKNENVLNENEDSGLMLLMNLFTVYKTHTDDNRNEYFQCLTDYVDTLTIEHYGCMVDLLSRIGYFYVAEDLLVTMPPVPDNILRTSILSACRAHGNMEKGGKWFDNTVHECICHLNAYAMT